MYSDIVMERNREPHHHYEIPDFTFVIDGNNAVCGDKIALFIEMDGDKIADATFQHNSCAIACASTDLMLDLIIGKTFDEIREIYDLFNQLMCGKISREDKERLGELSGLDFVSHLNARKACAYLPWEILMKEIEKRG